MKAESKKRVSSKMITKEVESKRDGEIWQEITNEMQ